MAGTARLRSRLVRIEQIERWLREGNPRQVLGIQTGVSPDSPKALLGVVIAALLALLISLGLAPLVGRRRARAA